jgi:hypothetical protein
VYAGGYAQNSGGYAPNIGYSNPYPPAASYSNVSLVAYQQDPKLAVSFFSWAAVLEADNW